MLLFVNCYNYEGKSWLDFVYLFKIYLDKICFIIDLK